MNDLFGSSNTLMIIGLLVVFAGFITCVVGGFTSIGSTSVPGFAVSVIIGFVMFISGAIIAGVANCQKQGELVKQVSILNQHCQRFTKECKKMNIPIVWKPVHARTETQMRIYSRGDRYVDGHSTTYNFYDIEIHY